MTFTYRPARQISDAAGTFISLTGGTNSGKSKSALLLAEGIAGPGGRVAVLDTEGGRMLNLRNEHDFDAMLMEPPFKPDRFAEAAAVAEGSGYACLVIDSFSMEWIGPGGVLEWIDEEQDRLSGGDPKKFAAVKSASLIKPKGAHKRMMTSLLQRRMPIIFSIRGGMSFDPRVNKEIFKAQCNKAFPFEVTVAFQLDQARKGYIDLSDPTTYKMEEAHTEIFKHGDRIGREHGAALKQLSHRLKGSSAEPSRDPAAPALITEGGDAAERGSEVLKAFWTRLTPAEQKAAGGKPQLERWKGIAADADTAIAAEGEREGELAQ